MAESDLNPPAWITQPLSPADIAAILQGGCDSGAYMPAVTYHEALATMAEHGDSVLDYLDGLGIEWPRETSGLSWSGLACFFLSGAVEVWRSEHEHLADWDNDSPLWGDA